MGIGSRLRRASTFLSDPSGQYRAALDLGTKAAGKAQDYVQGELSDPAAGSKIASDVPVVPDTLFNIGGADILANQAADAKRRRRGYASTIFAGNSGTPNTGARTLLGGA